MERKEIKINYEGSGVKTLNGLGTLFIVLGSISLLASVISLPIYNGTAIVISFFGASIGLFMGGGLCKGLSGIARSLLYKREVLRQEYYFIKE